MVVTLLAIIFLIMWAYKALDKKELKRWTQWLFIVGIIGCLVTAAGMFMGVRGSFGDDDGNGKGRFMMGGYDRDFKGSCPFLDGDSPVKTTTIATPAVVNLVK